MKNTKNTKDAKTILFMSKKASQNSSHEFNINPGLTSILLIFAILCLVCFAALTYVSANSDRKLNDKVITRTTEYYTACNTAQEVISQIDAELLDAYKNTSDSQEYFDITGTYRSFFVNVNSTQNLYVSIEIQYPETDTDSFYAISEWYVDNISCDAVIIEE